MKRILRKVASIFIATAMVAAMGVSAFAADENENINGNGTVIGNKDPADPVKKTLIIEKELTVYNPETTEVYAPNVTYTYTIAGIDASKQVKDSGGVQVTTKTGPDGATITSSISWTSAEKVAADVNGARNTKDLKIDLSGVTFTGAGVYRYEITETCTGKAAAGVTEGDITETRYLDVYVRDPKTGTSETGYQIYGYVLFQNNNNIDGTDTDSVKAAIKTEGFVAANDGTDDLSADSYYTYNVTVRKTLVNDSANDTHGFPFAVYFTKASGVSGSFNLVASNDANAVAMPNDGDTTVDPALKIANGNSVTYTGIPCGTQVNVTETNDLTTSAYKVTTSGANTNITSAVLLNSNQTTEKTAVVIDSTSVDTAATANFTVTFTNTLELISPTGVAMAILPFVILLGFGIGFMVLGTTKRKEEYEV